MKRKSPRQMEDDRRLAERAAEWIALLPSSTVEERAEFAAWLKESPQHLQEFLFTSAVVHGMANIDLAGIESRAALRTENVIELAQVYRAELPSSSPQKAPLRWRLPAALAAGVTALVAAGFVWMNAPKTYTTDIGEQRAIHLEDGSIMQLNAGSQVRVQFTDGARTVRLVEGEAMFKVEHDPVRPFSVRTNTNVIKVLGTEFNVLRRPSGITVSVIEGKVQISPDNANASAERLEAGEEARIGPDGKIEQRTPIDVVRVAGWRRNRLDFRADKLIDIAAEFNRYNEAPQVVVEDGIAADRRYSGVFDANDPRSLAEFLREDTRLSVEERGTAISIKARGAEPISPH